MRIHTPLGTHTHITTNSTYVPDTMGGFFSSLWKNIFGGKETRVLILGLDSAGKTTILYRLHCGEVLKTTPTIGFNMEVVEYKNIKFNVWDLGGQDSIVCFPSSLFSHRVFDRRTAFFVHVLSLSIFPHFYRGRIGDATMRTQTRSFMSWTARTRRASTLRGKSFTRC